MCSNAGLNLARVFTSLTSSCSGDSLLLHGIIMLVRVHPELFPRLLPQRMSLVIGFDMDSPSLIKETRNGGARVGERSF